MLPTVIVSTANHQKNTCQSGIIPESPSTKMRRSIANAAAFDPTDRYAVIGVGAPS